MASITLNDLVVLNEELVALTRAGVSLEQGLGELGKDFPGELGRLAQRLAKRLAEGADLTQAFREETHDFPPAYQAVIVAGLKTGKLPAALENLSHLMQKLAELRSAIGVALIYPLMMFITAYALLIVVLVVATPNFERAFAAFAISPGTGMTGASWLSSTLWMWVPLVPPCIVAVLLVWRRQNRPFATSTGMGRWLRKLPLIGAMIRAGEVSQMCDLLALLIEQEMPLDDSLRLAAAMIHDPALSSTLLATADAAQRGEPLDQTLTAAAGVPPFLRWLLSLGWRERALVPALRQAGELYRQQCLRKSEHLHTFLPALLTILMGGIGMALFVLFVFLPLVELWMGLIG